MSLPFRSRPEPRILLQVFLGNEENAKDIETLRKLQISHILNTASDCANFYPESFVYHNLNVWLGTVYFPAKKTSY
jgi:hypothetical protein